MPGRKGRQPLAFYVCGLSQVTFGPINSGQDLWIPVGLGRRKE
jgi:hypothetical protein